jgi:protein TonB
MGTAERRKRGRETLLDTEQTERSDTTLRHSVRPSAVRGRLMAAAAAVGLNLVLFAAMPYLQHPAQARLQVEPPLTQVEIVRVQRPETTVKRRTDPPPEPPQTLQRSKPAPGQPLQAKLALPFVLNPKLPVGPGDLALPDLAPASFDPSGVGDAFAVGDLDGPLTVLSRMPPVYPLGAKHRGIEGWVRIRFLVREDGRIGKIEVMESKPAGTFDESVRQCVSGWRFKPGTIDGMAVKAWAETTIRFELK